MKTTVYFLAMSLFAVMAVTGLASAAEEKGKDWTSMGSATVQARGASSPAEALFVEKCGMCHRQMGMGTVILARRVDPARAMLEQRNDLTAEYIRVAVRTGLGNMPRVSRGEVTDEQLASITSHLLKTVKP
jgi:mono/diheme cytochrome c family protein